MRIQTGPKGNRDVEISQVGAEHPVLLKLPASVMRIVRQEISRLGRIHDPAERLADSYREWESCSNEIALPCGGRFVTCYDHPGADPALLFWTLEHFSDADFPLAEKQKLDLMFHTFDKAEEIRGEHVRDLMSTDSADSLEYCWLFLARLLVIENRLAASDRARRSVQQHIGLIHCHYSLLLQDLDYFHESGWVATESPTADIERRLFELAARYPNLQPTVAQIILNWEKLEANAEQLNQIAEIRAFQLLDSGDWPVDEAEEADTDDDVAGHLRRHERALRKIRCLERAMTPEGDDDQAWHHPLEYVEKRAVGRRVLFLLPAIEASDDEKLSNGQKFALALLEHMAQQGFRAWLFSEPERNLRHVHRWLKQNRDSRSMKALCATIQQYMMLPTGRRAPSLRDFFVFPNAPEPLPVTQELQYWQQLWETKNRVAAEVRLFMFLHDDENAEAMKWMRDCADRKFIAVGRKGNFQDFWYSDQCITREKSLVVHHRPALPDYDFDADRFRALRAFHYAAHEVGRKKGWGIHQSAALSIQDNRRFLDACRADELQESSIALRCLFSVTTTAGDYADAAIFTAEEDPEDRLAFFGPAGIDAGVPGDLSRIPLR